MLSDPTRTLPQGGLGVASSSARAHKQKESPMFSVTLLERKTRLELATPTLARSCSTN